MELSFEVKFILLALAVYRAAAAFTQDDGPADVFVKIRAWAGVYDYDEYGNIKTSLGKLFDCPYCLGYWFCLPALVLLLFVPFTLEGFGLLWLIALWWALAGAQSVLETFAGRAQGKNIEVRLDEETRGLLKRIAERVGE